MSAGVVVYEVGGWGVVTLCDSCVVVWTEPLVRGRVVGTAVLGTTAQWKYQTLNIMHYKDT